MSVNRSLSLHDALPISGKGVPCFNKFCGIVEKGCDYIMLVVGDDPICTLLITPEFLVYSQIDYSVQEQRFHQLFIYKYVKMISCSKDFRYLLFQIPFN